MSKRKDKQTAANVAQETKTVNVEQALQKAFTLAATTSAATVQAKGARNELSKTMLAVATACRTAQAFEAALDKFSAYLVTADGQAFQKQAGIQPHVTKKGQPKVPASFTQYKSTLLRYLKGADAGILPPVEEVPSESKARAIMAEKPVELGQLKLAGQAKSETEKATEAEGLKVQAERNRLMATIAERVKALEGDRLREALGILGTCSAALLPLVTAQRAADDEARKAAEDAKKAKEAALAALPETQDSTEAQVVAA